MGYRVTQIQSTPNPNAAKFILEREISPHPISFLSPDQGKDHPIAARIFEIRGVSSLLILGDFLTVNKENDVKWEEITQKVLEILQKCS